MIRIHNREGGFTLAQKTINYKLHKIDLTDAPPDITVLNPNFDTIDKELKGLHDAVATPYLIREGTDIPVNERASGKIYFKVTSKQSGGNANNVKVNPNMGLKID